MQDGSLTGAVLGIGVNVETTPEVDPTPFVPRAGALRDVASASEHCRLGVVFEALTSALDRNYRALLVGGRAELLDRYRSRSLVLGREAVVCAESSGTAPDVIAEGRVVALSDHLELVFEGREEPVRKGRLILDDGRTLVRSETHGTA
jgi:biotin-(acetyl-CoA carboxylase) ligase